MPGLDRHSLFWRHSAAAITGGRKAF